MAWRDPRMKPRQELAFWSTFRLMAERASHQAPAEAGAGRGFKTVADHAASKADIGEPSRARRIGRPINATTAPCAALLEVPCYHIMATTLPSHSRLRGRRGIA